MSNALQSHRQQKDQFLKQHPQSPIPQEKRGDFTGLNYYPHNAALDLQLEAEEFDYQDEIQMQTSTGDMRPYLRWGRVNFEVNGKAAALTLYFSPELGHFFLPFMDTTSGKDTYGAGRYLDIEQVADGVFQIDFNMAYSPFCAYNPLYSCPIPPPENRLSVAIEAGEKNIDLG